MNTIKLAAIVTAAVIPLTGTAIVAPAYAAPDGGKRTVAGVVVKAFYQQSPSQQRNLCRVWRVSPLRVARPLVKVSIRYGYSRKVSARGVVLGLTAVCGTPYGYGGVSA